MTTTATRPSTLRAVLKRLQGEEAMYREALDSHKPEAVSEKIAVDLQLNLHMQHLVRSRLHKIGVADGAD
jgi:hypothetical protein